MQPLDVLVLGVGNILLGDEGAGIAAVQELVDRYRLPPEVEVVDGGTMGLELLPYLDDRSHLLIVDAMRTGQVPGTTSRLSLEDPPSYFRSKISPHQLGLSEVLAVAAMTGTLPPNVVLFGIEPQSLDTGLGLSGPVREQLPRLVEQVAAELEALGIAMAELAA